MKTTDYESMLNTYFNKLYGANKQRNGKAARATFKYLYNIVFDVSKLPF